MTPERWRKIEQLHASAREREPDQRGPFLYAACGDDSDLRREIETLLQGGDSQKLSADGAPTQTIANVGVGAQLGPYKIEAPIGSGGMGEVFRAIDTRLGRPVAIKTSRERFSERFNREARVISSLNHPHICTLYDVGPNYLVMELCEGETLAARLKRGKLSIEETIRYGAQIADALAAAHAKGIVHRDLKPHNVMLGKPGIKVLDFGLAKSPQDETLTASHAVMGTPAYMAPEQQEGKDCDARTDIYALGLMLCEMVTGKRVGHGQTPALDQLPEKLSHLIERCLAQDPDGRWQSARDVNAELAWAGKAPLRTGPELNLRRRPSIAYAVGSSLLAVAIIAMAWIVVAGRNGKETNGASLPTEASLLTIANYTGTERSGAISPDGKFFAFVSNRGGNSDIWVRQISGGEPVQITHDAVGEQDLVYARDGESIYYATTGAPPAIQRVGVLGGTPRTLVTGARFPAPSPDGKQLAYGTISTRLFASDSIQIADADGGHPHPLHQGPDGLTLQDLSWSPDGHWLAYDDGSLFTKHTINIVDPTENKPKILDSLSGRAYSLTWASDSRHLVFSNDPHPLADRADIWMKPIDGGPARRLSLNPRGAFRSIRISQDGTRLLGSIEDVDYEIWKVPLQGDPASNAAAAVRLLDSSWQPMWTQLPRVGLVLFNSPATGERNLWSMPMDGSATPRQITFLPGSQISHASLSPDGRQVAFVSVSSGTGQIWVANADGSAIRQLTSDASAKSWPFWSPDGKWIMFAAQYPGRPQLWKVPSSGGKAEQFTQDGGLRGDWSPTGDRVAYDVEGVEGTGVRIAAASSGRVLQEIKDIYSPVWSPDGKVISAHGRSSVWTVNPDSGQARLAIQFPQSYQFYFRAAWAPDGKSIVVNKATTTSRIVLLENFE